MSSLYPFPSDDNPPKKTCTGPCGRTLDATKEYFYAVKGGKYGLRSKCKECYAEHRSRPEVKEQRKEYFSRPEVKAHKKEYRNRPEVKAQIKEQRKEYYSRPEVKAHQQEYQKEYNKRPGVKAHQREYYHSRLEAKERRRKRLRQPEAKLRQKEYYDRPETRKRLQEYYSIPEVKNRRREYHKEYYSRPEVRDWRKRRYNGIFEVRLRILAHNHNRRANKRGLGTHTPEQIQDQLKRQKRKCYYCHAKFKRTKGKYIYHIEHTFPLSRVESTDIPANSIDYIVLSCPTCNLRKHDKFPWEWAEGGRLL